MDPFRRLTQAQVRKALAVMLPVTGAACLVIALTNQPLQNGTARLGVISLQLACTPARAAEIIGAWGESERTLAAFNLGFDYLYLLAYALLLALACAYLARFHLAKGSERFAMLGFGLAWAMPVAATLDAIENYALLQILLGDPAPGWPALATGCAIPKFGIVAAALAYIASASIGPLRITLASIGKRLNG